MMAIRIWLVCACCLCGVAAVVDGIEFYDWYTAHAKSHEPTPPKQADPKALAEPASIEGIYLSLGVDGKKPYWSVVTIRKLGDGLFSVNYLTMETHTTGIGVRTGDMFAVGWRVEGSPVINSGCTMYRIDGKTLKGRWVTQAGGRASGPHSETLTWLRGLPGGDL